VKISYDARGLAEPDELAEFNRRLILEHRVGQGDPAPADVVRAQLLLVVNGFARGTSGVRFELLEHVDHLHRSCVWKVFELATQLGGKGLIDRMVQDSAVKTLFMLYDLIPVDPLMPVQADGRVAPPAGAAFQK